jgi:hypothetical protein
VSRRASRYTEENLIAWLKTEESEMNRASARRVESRHGCRPELRILALAFLLSAGPAGAVEVFFDPEIIHTVPLDVFTVSVNVADLDSRRGYELEIEFDSGLIDFESAAPGGLFDDYSPPQGLYWSVEDQDSLLRIECLIIPQDECLAGPGEILELAFTVLEEQGESPLHIAEAIIRNCDGSPIEPVGTSDGSVVIEPGVEIFFDPELTYASYPDTFTVSVEVANLDSLRGYEIDIEFNDGLVDFLDAAPGELFDDFSPPFELLWMVEDLGNLVRIVCLVVPGDECAEGSGEILELSFTALDAHGETPLHIAAITLSDCAGAPIEPFQAFDGQAVVGAAVELFFDPDPKYVFGARPFHVSLDVGAVDSLRGFQVYLSYDSTMIDFDSALPGDLLEPPPPLWWYVVEESPRLVRIEGVILGPDLFVNGPGELAELHFTCLVDSGVTEIEFEEWHVWDVNTDELYPIAVDDGLLIIDWHLQEVPEGLPTAAAPRLILGPARGSPGSAPSFRCTVGATAHLRAIVYDICGRAMCELTPRSLDAGAFRIDWDGRDAMGRPAAPGIYLMRVSTGKVRATGKIVLVR